MKRTEIARIFADMEHFDGQDVTVCGWTRTIRDMKNFGFYRTQRRQLLQKHPGGF